MKSFQGNALPMLVIALSLGSGLLPWYLPKTKSVVDKSGFPGWPEQWDGTPLEMDTLDKREEEQIQVFPGMIGRFRCGQKIVVIHWITRRTRLFHFSEFCLRGGGWRITKLPNEVDRDGVTWAVHSAQRGNQKLKLSQRIEAANDPQVKYVDPSKWFWSFLSEDPGPPYWAYTVAEPWGSNDRR